ncbi:MAG: class I SAM-dependent methyltransferase, partial [Solobacterium sp.]|nr:class I SAM-dependent methyltransferase [Solobacterium sp.]
MNEAVFATEAGKLGIGLTDAMLKQFRDYIVLLQEWNEKMNLTAITDPEEIYEKHFLDCLTPLAYAGLHGQIADIGSGAGFPGLVFAIARPDLDI